MDNGRLPYNKRLINYAPTEWALSISLCMIKSDTDDSAICITFTYTTFIALIRNTFLFLHKRKKKKKITSIHIYSEQWLAKNRDTL